MAKLERTLTGRVFGGTQVVLSALGLSGAVEGFVGLSDLAAELIASYLTLSRWVMDRISENLQVAPPELLFHYLLLGAPFWTSTFLGVRRMLRAALPVNGILIVFWQVFWAPTSAILVAVLKAPTGKKISKGLFNLPPKHERAEIRRKYRELRRTEFFKWIKLSHRVNLVRFAFIALLFLLVVAVIGLPVLMVLFWPLYLFSAIRVKIRSKAADAAQSEAPQIPQKPDPYIAVLGRALDKFALVVFVFLIFAAVTAGIDRNGGIEVLVEDFLHKLEEALK